MRRKGFQWRKSRNERDPCTLTQAQADDRLLMCIASQTMQALKVPVHRDVVTRLEQIAARREIVFSDRRNDAGAAHSVGAAHDAAALQLNTRVVRLEHTQELIEQSIDQLLDECNRRDLTCQMSLYYLKGQMKDQGAMMEIVTAQIAACHKTLDTIDCMGHMIVDSSSLCSVRLRTTGNEENVPMPAPDVQRSPAPWTMNVDSLNEVDTHEATRWGPDSHPNYIHLQVHPDAHPAWLDVDDVGEAL